MKKMFMAVIALMMTISVSAQFYLYCSDGNVIKVDSISMIAPADEPDTPVEPEEPDTPTEPEDPTNPSAGIGVFSVGEGRQVTFSKGNLQYTQSTNTWSFAENQYDYLGEANIAIDADVLADKVDLFGWSTATTNFGVSTSTSDSDYSGSFVDWGTNKIGNDAPNTWRTLSYDEWEYLLNNRPNASSLCGVAQVNGVNGLILLPDNWVCPSDITFKSGFHSSYGVDYYAAYQTFTVEQWSKLEAAGAVFLPAAGRRDGTGVYYVRKHGSYWSATEDNSGNAYCLYLFSDATRTYNYSRYFGHTVRLVKDIEGGGATPDTPDTPTEPEESENTENGHEYVDLGLSVKWATCNVGATKPEEYGDYFAWGEVEPKEVYDWSTYKWCEGGNSNLTKYCIYSNYGSVDNKTTLEATDDAATANWGGSWRMPTEAEFQELSENCTWTWKTRNGIGGFEITSNKEGYTYVSIFIPAAGHMRDSALKHMGDVCNYWSSTLFTYGQESYCARCLDIYYWWTNASILDSLRYFGRSVRPVCQ